MVYNGMSVQVMSNEFLLISYEELCYKTNGDAGHPEDWLDEKNAVKAEILKRMKEAANDA